MNYPGVQYAATPQPTVPQVPTYGNPAATMPHMAAQRQASAPATQPAHGKKLLKCRVVQQGIEMCCVVYQGVKCFVLVIKKWGQGLPQLFWSNRLIRKNWEGPCKEALCADFLTIFQVAHNLFTWAKWQWVMLSVTEYPAQHGQPLRQASLPESPSPITETQDMSWNAAAESDQGIKGWSVGNRSFDPD